MTTSSVTYGIGGYDPEHPNGNVIERLIDNGDGTGTRTTYDATGTVAATTELTGLPVAESNLTAEVAAARASLAAAITVAQVRTRTLALIDLITP